MKTFQIRFKELVRYYCITHKNANLVEAYAYALSQISEEVKIFGTYPMY